MYTLSKDGLTTRNMVKISVLGAIGMILMFFGLNVWFAPGFLKLDIADLPSLLGAFAMGPMAGVLVQLIKNILKLIVKGTSTGGVGEISNFIVGSIFAYSAGYFYYREKNFKNAVIGLTIGVITMTLCATISNYFVIFPLYGKVIPMDKIIGMSAAVNKYVVDLKSLMLFAVIPFNLIKGTVTAAITLLIYKRLSPILHS